MGHAIAVFGGTGIGKSTWGSTITKPELTRVLSFEGLQKGVIPPDVDVRDVMDKYDPFEPESVKEAEQVLRGELQKAHRDAKAGKLRVLILDGFNTLHDAATVLSMELYPKRADQRAPLEQSIIRPALLALRRINCLVIVTAHEASRYEKNVSGGKRSETPIGVQAAIGGGGMREKLGSYVDDIWYMSQTGKVRKFMTQGSGAEGADAKSRLKGTDGQPLLASNGVLVEDASKALRIYMGWTRVAGEPAAGAGVPVKPAVAPVATSPKPTPAKA